MVGRTGGSQRQTCPLPNGLGANDPGPRRGLNRSLPPSAMGSSIRRSALFEHRHACGAPPPIPAGTGRRVGCATPRVPRTCSNRTSEDITDSPSPPRGGGVLLGEVRRPLFSTPDPVPSSELVTLRSFGAETTSPPLPSSTTGPSRHRALAARRALPDAATPVGGGERRGPDTTDSPCTSAIRQGSARVADLGAVRS